MSKRIVIGGLVKYRGGGDSLKFNSTGYARVDESLVCADPFPVTFVMPAYEDDLYMLSKYSTGNNKRSWGFQMNGGALKLNTSSDGLGFTTSTLINLPIAGSRVRVEKSGTNITWFVNDLASPSTGGAVSVLFSSDVDVLIGTRFNNSGTNSVSPSIAGYLSEVSFCGFKYINNGDFGSSGVPSQPAGADGVLSNTTWWKKGVDENYLTPQAYKSSWPIPMEDDQNVIYTDATPYYPTDDVFWNPYNQDVTYTFNVNKQPVGGATTDGFAFTNYTYSYSY